MLRLLPPPRAPERTSGEVFEERGYSLASRPQRPGELTVTVTVTLGDAAREHVATGAARDRVPVALWLVVAIEAERCVRRAAALVGASTSDLAGIFDEAAAVSEVREVHGSPALSQLRGYATALRNGEPTSASIMAATMPLSPAIHVGAAWAIAAEAFSISVEAWASSFAASLPTGRLAWEAASAADGQSLAEWTLLQATRRCRSANTSACSRARA